MGIFHIKLLFAFIIFASSLFAGWIPYHKRIVDEKAHDFPIMEAFACGIFLGAGLIHMLPDSADLFATLGFDYPFAALLSGITFLSLLFLEHVCRELKAHAKQQYILALLTVLILSIHSLLAGLALGLSSTMATTIMVVIAIMSHKWAASFALSVQLNKSHLPLKMSLIAFVIFACMTPLGIISGSLMAHQHGSHQLEEAIFNALAAGTFLYIGTLHGLKSAVMINRCCNTKEYFFVIIGFALMAAVALWM